MEAIILAGGRGTRLSSAVPDLPKPMASVAGRPFLSYLLATLVARGFTHICLSTGYKGEAILKHFGHTFEGTRLTYAREESPLGTGGAIRAAFPYTSAASVFVFNGDTLTDIDLQALQAQHERSGDQLTVALTEVCDSARYGTVSVAAEHITGFTEKGLSGRHYINAGIYLVRRGLFNTMRLPDAFSFEKEILMDHLSEVKPGAFLSSGYFIDIGIPEDYARAQRELPIIAMQDDFAGPKIFNRE